MPNKLFFFLLAALILAGLGCKSVDQSEIWSDEPIESTADQVVDIFAQRRASDSITNLLPVALVLTEGHEAPINGVERLADKTFGCSDRIGYVRVSRETATDDVVKDALETLFAIREPQTNGMLNSLWESTLKVEQIRSVDGFITEVWLTGDLSSPGVCADP
ncbi:hypothetical protein KKC47_00435, partial [Patescibacteria group bacterium]|nr:hypothetical protein [Patescibacteria group bacterium]